MTCDSERRRFVALLRQHWLDGLAEEIASEPGLLEEGWDGTLMDGLEDEPVW